MESYKETKNKTLIKYLEVLNNLRIGDIPHVTHTHLRVLLSSFFHCVELKEITSMVVFLSNELEEHYNEFFRYCTSQKKPNLSASYAFIQLGYQSFFSLVLNAPIKNSDIIWNRTNVYRYVKYLKVDEAFFKLCTDSKSNLVMYRFLQQRYSNDKPRAFKQFAPAYTEKEELFSKSFFKEYVFTLKSPYGESYTENSARYILGQLNGKYMKALLSRYKLGTNIYDIRDEEPISFLIGEACKDYAFNYAKSSAIQSLRLYLKFIKTIKQL